MDELLADRDARQGWRDELARKTYVVILELLMKPAARASAAEAPKGKLRGHRQGGGGGGVRPVVDAYRRKLGMALF